MMDRLHVLIVEDDPMIAEISEEILLDNGYAVCGVTGCADEAVAMARKRKPDLALIDLRLSDNGSGTEVGARLVPLGRIGVIYTTGNAAPHVFRDAIGDACLIKPYVYEDLVRALEIVSTILATGAASPPFPRQFRLLNAARRV